MYIEHKDIEVVKKERGYALHLSEEEARIVVASLGKAKTEEVKDYVKHNFGFGTDIDTNRVNDVAYRLYCDLSDYLGIR